MFSFRWTNIIDCRRSKFTRSLTKPIDWLNTTRISTWLTFTHSDVCCEKQFVNPFLSEINLLAVESTQVQSLVNITVYCNDFRCVEFQLNYNQDAKSLLDNLEKLITSPPIGASSFLSPTPRTALPVRLTLFVWKLVTNLPVFQVSPQRVFELPLLWYQLTTEYQYDLLSDWQQNESKLLAFRNGSNDVFRVSHINEVMQVSRNLPRTFVTLPVSKLSDVTLDERISRQMRGRRVPLVTYCVEQGYRSKVTGDERNYSNRKLTHSVLMRSATLSEEVANLLQNALKKMRIIDLQSSMPTLVSVEAASNKLHEACFLDADTAHFISATGKWTKLVLKALRKALEVRTWKLSIAAYLISCLY